ncbi:MAG: D-alanyl-D-alanine carboxypeptidase [Proteobacteria bacterium]|nr:D-alanyl-D-alanine carboxypeptidase [Pseudomonadota bacterium]
MNLRNTRCSTMMPTVCIGLVLLGPVARAERAAVLIDINDGAVIYAVNGVRPSYPASLTKLMTLYLLFEALQAGRCSISTEFPVSAAAAAQPKVRLGLNAGEKISVNDAIDALIITSANDVAVVVAEALEGSVDQFAAKMNAKAVALGLHQTVFRNPNGLPDPGQITTARDMALLGRALFDHYPNYFERFKSLSFEFKDRQRMTHNNFLLSYDGARGLKTGFTCNAGYNLVASAERNGRHILGVILGEASASARDARMASLMNVAFKSKTRRLFKLNEFPLTADQGANEAPNKEMIATACIDPEHTDKPQIVSNWSIEFGVEVDERTALGRAETFIQTHQKLLNGEQPMLIPRWTRKIIYRVGVTALEKDNAISTCLAVRTEKNHCIVRSPMAGNFQMEKAHRILEAIARRDKQLKN